jgi:hypothetical protein
VKVELRQFKHKTFLLLICETTDEARLVDETIGETTANPIPVRGELCSDDAFRPYLRFRKT